LFIASCSSLLFIKHSALGIIVAYRMAVGMYPD